METPDEKDGKSEFRPKWKKITTVNVPPASSYPYQGIEVHQLQASIKRFDLTAMSSAEFGGLLYRTLETLGFAPQGASRTIGGGTLFLSLELPEKPHSEMLFQISGFWLHIGDPYFPQIELGEVAIFRVLTLPNRVEVVASCGNGYVYDNLYNELLACFEAVCHDEGVMSKPATAPKKRHGGRKLGSTPAGKVYSRLWENYIVKDKRFDSCTDYDQIRKLKNWAEALDNFVFFHKGYRKDMMRQLDWARIYSPLKENFDKAMQRQWANYLKSRSDTSESIR